MSYLRPVAVLSCLPSSHGKFPNLVRVLSISPIRVLVAIGSLKSSLAHQRIFRYGPSMVSILMTT